MKTTYFRCQKCPVVLRFDIRTDSLLRSLFVGPESGLISGTYLLLNLLLDGIEPDLGGND